MTRSRRWIPLLLILLGGAAPLSAQDFIARAKRVRVVSLDSTLPSIPFERWLKSLGAVGDSAVDWEVNDCGEGGDGNVAPTCVEAFIDLGQDTTASASLLVVGTDGKRAKRPVIWGLWSAADSSYTPFETLHEWGSYVRAHKR
jgi:hypothetical protein